MKTKRNSFNFLSKIQPRKSDEKDTKNQEKVSKHFHHFAVIVSSLFLATKQILSVQKLGFFSEIGQPEQEDSLAGLLA